MHVVVATAARANNTECFMRSSSPWGDREREKKFEPHFCSFEATTAFAARATFYVGGRPSVYLEKILPNRFHERPGVIWKKVQTFLSV